MSPSIDFSEVKDPEPIPDGNYLASIVEAKEGTSKNNNPKIDLHWRVESGPFEGRYVFDTLTFTEKAAGRVKAVLKALDFPADFKGDVPLDDLIGKSAMITVGTEVSTEIDPNTGEPYAPRNKVKRVRPVSAAPAGTTNFDKLMK